MPEPSRYHPLRGYSPFRALAQRLRAQFQAEDAARAVALEADIARRAAARARYEGALAPRSAAVGAPAASAARTPKTRSRRLVH